MYQFKWKLITQQVGKGKKLKNAKETKKIVVTSKTHKENGHDFIINNYFFVLSSPITSQRWGLEQWR